MTLLTPQADDSLEILGSARASDADRDLVIRCLSEAHSEGRLSLPVLEARVSAASTAGTRASLEPLTSDLAVDPEQDLYLSKRLALRARVQEIEEAARHHSAGHHVLDVFQGMLLAGCAASCWWSTQQPSFVDHPGPAIVLTMVLGVAIGVINLLVLAGRHEPGESDPE